MNISKEERERLRQSFDKAAVFKSNQQECLGMFPELLDALDEADSEKAELQQENERLNYMLRYIDATAVDRRLTMKANEAWLKRRDREAGDE